ncbi:MAG TPA: peptide-N4-asparagine amidase [Frateuria sp.]|uniref:peptide-N4-asparagine amidase n=1 Tax=Frateuria sp. TaxID=2211372 RepID=UPI002D7F177F|nr:peptide-N4-asparagine amidase [Frateuria sp.]HET6807113.1 peptide-N4-asparagine amidase [Frateuria sp.]
MTLRHDSLHRALFATACTLAPVFGAAAQSPTGPVVAPQVASTNPVASVDPRVPVAAGQPCVVELLHDRAWPMGDPDHDPNAPITYMPPSACPPPWAKVILKLDVRSVRRSITDTLGMDLARVRLFRSITPRYDGNSRWHLERDLTDYSALFRAPRTGSIWMTQNEDFPDPPYTPPFYATARLFFYPSSAATPAPRVPDAVIPVNQETPVNLPHNIVRAYLDVEADYFSGDGGLPRNFWYTCVIDWSGNGGPLELPQLTDVLAPGGWTRDAINPYAQGCSGGNYREFKIAVDGTLAGIAPVFPLLVADMNNYHHNSADQPIPTLEMLNFKPYRVDLTPFAALLSAAGRHNVTVDNRYPYGYDRYGGSALLVYLDPQRTQVTGAVTLNTLTTGSGAPHYSNTLRRIGDTIVGDIHTRQQREFEIRGFVNTSQGRIDSRVHQTGAFASTQVLRVQGPYGGIFIADKAYRQDLSLSSTVQQTSRRAIGTRLISWDRTSTSYPLQMAYRLAAHVQTGDGWNIDFTRTNVSIAQSRVIDGDHYKPGFGHYTTHAGARFYSVRKGGADQTDPRWESSTLRNYRDNFGSCYHGEVAARDDAIVRLSRGDTCPGGRNQVRWFAHPDGSPDTLGWWR